MKKLDAGTLTAADIDLLLSQGLRQELQRIMADQACAADRTDAEIDARIESLEAEIAQLKRAARRNDFEPVAEWNRQAAHGLGLELVGEADATFGRRALSMKREIAELEKQTEDGEDMRHLAEPLVAKVSDAPVDAFTTAPITLNAGFEKAKRLYPNPSMQVLLKTTYKLVTEFLGDVPMDILSEDRQRELFGLIARLPKHHGRAHGKNRFCNNGTTLAKREEIERAEAHDARVTEEVRLMDHLSIHEKRVLLAERLTPRTTLATLKKHRDTFARFVRAAQELGAAQTIKVIGYKELERVIARERTDDALYLRVEKPKTRQPWTDERLAQLLTSPIYTGCASRHRRWKPGHVIVRDATYWVPLIVMSIGARLSEVLQLKRTNIVRRNGVICFSIGLDPDFQVKNDDSVRFVPVPQFLLDFGFFDWVWDLPDDHGAFLFPDALDRSAFDASSDAFGKHLKYLYSRLGLADYDEDFYALRKTLATRLAKLKISDSIRQAILGHKCGTIINRHYIAQEAPALKEVLDEVSFNVAIKVSNAHGFPVVERCSHASATVFDVNVTLDVAGQADVISITPEGATTPCFSARLSKTADRPSAQNCTTPPMDRRKAAQQYRTIIENGVARWPEKSVIAVLERPSAAIAKESMALGKKHRTSVGLASSPVHPALGNMRSPRRTYVAKPWMVVFDRNSN